MSAARGWTVTVQLELGHDPTEVADRDLLDELAEDLGAHAAAVAGAGRTVEATMSATAVTWTAAAEQALSAVSAALARRGHKEVNVLAVEVITDEEADRRLARPGLPELVSSPEAADILGVSRQRVHQLLRDRPDFPEPLLQPGSGPLWARAAIERWAQTSTRSPGRRPATPAGPAAPTSTARRLVRKHSSVKAP